MLGKPLFLKSFTLLLLATLTFNPIFADDSLPNLIDSIEPSVLKITTDAGRLGSGFVIKDGLVVTNRHVVEEANAATVQFKDGRTFEVKGVAFDGKSLDLCILRCVGLSGDNSTPLLIAERPIRRGEQVLTFGMPRNLEFSVSEGIVSATRVIDGQAVIQTTAPISPGNSGGPLISVSDGMLIGINTFTRSDGQNLNFAISATELSHALGKLTPRPTLLNLKKVENPAGKAEKAGPLDYSLAIKKLWEEQKNETYSKLQPEIEKLEKAYSRAQSEGTRAALRVRLAELNHLQRTVERALTETPPRLDLSALSELKIHSYGYVQQDMRVIQVLNDQSCLILGGNYVYRLDDFPTSSLTTETVFPAVGAPALFVYGTFTYTNRAGIENTVFRLSPMPDFADIWTERLASEKKTWDDSIQIRDSEIRKAKTRIWKVENMPTTAEYIGTRPSATTDGGTVAILHMENGSREHIPFSKLDDSDRDWFHTYHQFIKSTSRNRR